MIYTLTLNPSIDYVFSVDNFMVGCTNRTFDEHIYPGGKGINISRMLNNLNVDSVALGFLSGFTGEKILNDLNNEGIKSDFVFLDKGHTRINLKFKNYDGTEINGLGPKICDEDLKEIWCKFNQLQNGDIVFLSGSIPNGLQQNLYSQIMKKYSEKDIRFIVDATKDSLMDTLQYRPYLIKPNKDELSEIFDVSITTKEQAVYYAKILKEKGALNVLVSLGSKGAVFVCCDGNIYMSNAPKGNLINSVGSGDSMLAGFISAVLQNYSYKNAFLYSVACGSATAFSEGFATFDEVHDIYKELMP